MLRLRPAHIVLAALIAAPAPCALAQDAAPDPAQLKALERQLEQTEAERERLQSQTASSARALEAVQAETIAVARDIQNQEHSLTVLEARVAELELEGARLNETLGRRDAQMVDVLMALERMALRPSDALALNPLAPSDAVRSAILLRAALPSITRSSAALQSELKELYRVRGEIVARKEEVAAGAAALVQKQAHLAALVKERAGRHEVLVARGEEATQRAAKIAREAEDLRALFSKLAEEKARRDAAEAKLRAAERAQEEKLAAEKAAAEAKMRASAPPAPAKSGERIVLKPPPGVPPAPSLSAEQQTASLPPPGSSSPGNEEAVTRSFAKARGTLPFPVAGALTGRYGATGQKPGETGLLAKGITISARPGAQVVAPFDGIVAFAGPFRGYGQLLIIEHSEGYHTLLAGMGHIDAIVGQRILAGEPVGVMENEGAPALYVELRRDGQPINPLPWLADRSGKKSG